MRCCSRSCSSRYGAVAAVAAAVVVAADTILLQWQVQAAVVVEVDTVLLRAPSLCMYVLLQQSTVAAAAFPQ